MIEFFMSFVGLVLLTITVTAGIIFPLWAISLAYRLVRSTQRIAASLERMEVRQVETITPPSLPTSDVPLQVVAGRPVVNSMFGR
jgi:hypothetical protein